MANQHWTLLDIIQTITATGYSIEVTSDVPCHLWMRWTTKPPRIHKTALLVRGLRTRDDVRFCFVVYEDNEQQEAGDTLVHTFLKEPWPACQTRYFYFQGQIGGVNSPSTTAIFTKHRVQPPITAYFYPDPDPEVTSVDGYVYRSPPYPYEIWSALRNRIGDNAAPSSNLIEVRIYTGLDEDKWRHIYRSVILFDTSSIPPGSTIIESKLRLRVYSRSIVTEWPGFAVGVVSSAPQSNTDVVPADYQSFGIQLLSDKVEPSDVSPGDEIILTLTPAGLAHIMPSGITKLGIREITYDMANLIPTWLYNREATILFHSADNPQEIRKPRLEVIYQP